LRSRPSRSLSAASAASVACWRSPIRFVDDDDRGIALWVALFFDHRWVHESGEQDCDGDDAPRHAPRTAQNPEGEKEQARGAERGDRVPRQKGRGGERKRIAAH
jgi:hypothetical protein